MKKIVLLAFVLVLLSTAVVVRFIRPAVAEGTIYIRADGSVEGTTHISSVDNVTYTFTDNIFNQSIVVERDNIVIDGVDYTIEGTRAFGSIGIDLTDRINVTIKNVNIRAFYFGIYLSGSSGNNVNGSNMTNNSYGIALSDFSSSNNSITQNNLGNNGKVGIYVFGSFNILSGNNITNSSCGIEFSYSSNNIVYGNIITASHYWGVWLSGSLNNSISGNRIANSQYGIYLSYSSNNSVYHNYFIGNTYQVGGTIETSSSNVWDDGAGKGNYWSDYEDKYPDAIEIDGIWDTPYVIDENNQDNYPLMGGKVPEEVAIGVKAGDWIKYDYSVTGAPSGTVLPTWMKVEILSVEGTNVTVRLTMHMSNGTEGSETLTLDVARTLPYTCGTFDTLFGFGFVIPANSTVEGDYIYIMLLSPAFMLGTQIDGETTGTYAEASRTVVYATFSYIGDRYGNKPLKYYWDKQTGIMVEASATLDGMTATAKATETNMWEAAPTEEGEEVPFWMQWWLWAIIAVVIIALAGTVYFLKKRKPPTPTAPPQGTELPLQLQVS